MICPFGQGSGAGIFEKTQIITLVSLVVVVVFNRFPEEESIKPMFELCLNPLYK